jgi:hypothetical protein
VAAAAPELTSKDILEVVSKVCTDCQMAVLLAVELHGNVRGAADQLGVAPTTVRDSLTASLQKIHRQLAA